MILSLLLASLVAAAPAQFFCAKDGGGREKAPLVVKAGGGKTLFLCGYGAKKGKGAVEVAAFRVFAVNEKGKKQKKPVFENEQELKEFRAKKSGEALLLDEMIAVERESIPTFQVKVECTAKGCEASKPACVFEAPKHVSKKALAAAMAYASGPKSNDIPDEHVIWRLAGLAYSGNEEAQALFENRQGIRLDGAAAEAYFDHQKMLRRLKAAGCLPKAP